MRVSIVSFWRRLQVLFTLACSIAVLQVVPPLSRFNDYFRREREREKFSEISSNGMRACSSGVVQVSCGMVRILAPQQLWLLQFAQPLRCKSRRSEDAALLNASLQVRLAQCVCGPERSKKPECLSLPLIADIA